MKRLWVAAAMAPLSFAALLPVATPAQADVTVSTATTTALQTSSSGNITIAAGGSIALTAAGPAVTLNSNNTVSNAGAITFTGVTGATGIQIDGGFTGNVTNTGTITVSETTTGTTTNQGVTTGPFANGSNRIGIAVVGATPYVGSIANAGTITIIGENSSGISIGAEMTGDLDQEGTISVTGGSTPTAGGQSGNVSYGVLSTGRVDGNVTLGGTITATGQNATGAAVNGGVGGTLVVDGSITASGFRSTIAPTDPLVLAALNGDQILQGGPALSIGGNVANGVTINMAVAATGNVSAVPGGTLTVNGSAPVLLIGGASDIVIGANSGNYSLTVGGVVTAAGTYPAPSAASEPFSATGIQIGGSNPLAVASGGTVAGDAFGNVSLASGMSVSGSVSATAQTHFAGQGDATGILIGSGATVPTLDVSGTVSALVNADAPASADTSSTSSNAVDVVTGGVVTTNGVLGNTSGARTLPVTVTGINVAAGGSVTTINNTGSITAAIAGIPSAANYTAAGGTQGQAVAIYDASGSVQSVTNTDTISATVTPIVPGQTASATNSEAVAMYLANVGGNVSVTQMNGAPVGNVTAFPNITGDVIFGNTSIANALTNTLATPTAITGSEKLDLEAGDLTGSVAFNGSGANSLTMNGNSTLTGAISQAASGTLAVDINSGILKMTAPTANYLGGPTAQINSPTFHVGSTGQVIFAVDPAAANATAAQFNVAGAATFDSGAKVGVAFTSKLTQAQTYTLVHAGTLSVGGLDTSLLGSLPYLYQGDISTTATDLDITVSVKSAAQLGFNSAQASAFNAIYQAISLDTAVQTDILSKTTKADLLKVYNQFLPDYSGGSFEALVAGQRELARTEAEAPIKLQTDGVRGWVQEIGYLTQRSDSPSANGYRAGGFGLAGGIENAKGDSAVGVAVAFLGDDVANSTQTNEGSMSTMAIEAGVYWRVGGEGLNLNANINGGYVHMGGHRLLLDQTAVGAVTLLRDAESQWSGALASAQFGVSYQLTMGRFYLRPEVSIDYSALWESAHTEHGGGAALNLAVASRMSQEGSALADLVFGYSFGDAIRWRPEVTVGWRQVITGGPGATTARFVSGGPSFTLSPDFMDTGGFLARLGVRATGTYADFSADANGEFRSGYQTYGARAVARFLF